MVSNQRLVITNAFSISMFKFPNSLTVTFRRITPEEARQLATQAGEVISYVRHQSTTEVLKRIFQVNINVNAGVYEYAEGDIIIMATLTSPARGTEVENPDIILYQIIPQHLE